MSDRGTGEEAGAFSSTGCLIEHHPVVLKRAGLVLHERRSESFRRFGTQATAWHNWAEYFSVPAAAGTDDDGWSLG